VLNILTGVSHIAGSFIEITGFVRKCTRTIVEMVRMGKPIKDNSVKKAIPTKSKILEILTIISKYLEASTP
jgi:hypothetical protein